MLLTVFWPVPRVERTCILCAVYGYNTHYSSEPLDQMGMKRAREKNMQYASVSQTVTGGDV